MERENGTYRFFLCLCPHCVECGPRGRGLPEEQAQGAAALLLAGLCFLA
jgi:hypothetical protein